MKKKVQVKKVEAPKLEVVEQAEPARDDELEAFLAELEKDDVKPEPVEEPPHTVLQVPVVTSKALSIKEHMAEVEGLALRLQTGGYEERFERAFHREATLLMLRMLERQGG